MTVGYGVTLALAFLLLVCYCLLMRGREPWLLLLFICVTVVNLGYLLLSLASTLPFAILANDIAYFGSVFLSMCMLFTVMRLCGFEVKRAHVILAVSLGVLMFAVVATSGLLPLYYKSVWIESVGGATKLKKEYGPLHPVYLVYLLSYFAAMIATVIHSLCRRKAASHKFATLLCGVVCGNILTWLLEKFIPWDFEFLSVTYILSELVFLLLFWMMQDYVRISDVPALGAARHTLGVDVAALPMEEKIARVLSALPKGELLAQREREVLEAVLCNKRRREIAEELHLSENTVKTYTRNLYNKLGVGSREELYKLLVRE